MNIIYTILASIVLGMMPEITCFFIFLIYTKNIKDKKLKLFLLISLVYIICMFINKYKIIYYILFIILIYLILKLLYKDKTQIIDIFVISLEFSYICLIGFITSRFLNSELSNYYIILIINRIILFIQFIFKNKYNKLYKLYCKLWNRNNKEKRPIKSITLRNISLILLNSLIFLVNLSTISIINSI